MFLELGNEILTGSELFTASIMEAVTRHGAEITTRRWSVMIVIFGWTATTERSSEVERRGTIKTKKLTWRRFDSCRSDYTQGIRRNPVQPLIPQDCAEGS